MVEEPLLLVLVLVVVWLVLLVTALTLGMVGMGVQVEMMVERIIRLGKASLVSVGINDL